jgi:cytochrome c oxidase subunit IV
VSDQHSHAQGEAHQHHSAAPYFIVWIALLVFTAVTVWTGKMHLGTLALPLALTIATVKSLLVLTFFMHLKEDKGSNRLVVGLAFVFVLLLMGIVLTDVATRFKGTTPQYAPFGAKVVLPAGAHGEAHGSGHGEEHGAKQ